MKFEWENCGDNYTFRAMVFRGWIVRYCEENRKFTSDGISIAQDWNNAMVFIPDILHEWVITKEAQ